MSDHPQETASGGGETATRPSRWPEIVALLVIVTVVWDLAGGAPHPVLDFVAWFFHPQPPGIFGA